MIKIHMDEGNEDWLCAKAQKANPAPLGTSQGNQPAPAPVTPSSVVSAPPVAPFDMGMRQALRRITAGEIHPGDRIKVMETVDGLKKDDKGVAKEVQNDMILVKFDGEPVERWVKDELMQQEQAKEEVLEEIDNPEGEGDEKGGGGPAGGGLGALLGM